MLRFDVSWPGDLPRDTGTQRRILDWLYGNGPAGTSAICAALAEDDPAVIEVNLPSLNEHWLDYGDGGWSLRNTPPDGEVSR